MLKRGSAFLTKKDGSFYGVEFNISRVDLISRFYNLTMRFFSGTI